MAFELYTPPTNGKSVPLFLNTTAGPLTDALLRIALATSSSRAIGSVDVDQFTLRAQRVEELAKILEWHSAMPHTLEREGGQQIKIDRAT